ncbi:MAG: hypothetical protein LBI36_07175, partial [Oscillospiraceae bacterium]|nr:hypothetical protein [Oscillospiraceae bacterium]
MRKAIAVFWTFIFVLSFPGCKKNIEDNNVGNGSFYTIEQTGEEVRLDNVFVFEYYDGELVIAGQRNETTADNELTTGVWVYTFDKTGKKIAENELLLFEGETEIICADICSGGFLR